MRIDGLRFLVGRWRGEGTLRGERVTTLSECVDDADGSLRLDVVTRREGRVVHRERVVFRAGPDGQVAATTTPREGVVQAWTVEGDARSVLLLSPGFLWRIAPGPAGYDETFDEVAAGGRATRVVALRHVRRKDRAP